MLLKEFLDVGNLFVRFDKTNYLPIFEVIPMKTVPHSVDGIWNPLRKDTGSFGKEPCLPHRVTLLLKSWYILISDICYVRLQTICDVEIFPGRKEETMLAWLQENRKYVERLIQI